MKKTILTLSSALCLVLALLVFSSNANNPVIEENEDFIVYSLHKSDLERAYGKNIVLEDEMNLADLESVNFLKMGNPCAGSDFQKCGPAEARARRTAQRYANNCCCTITFGYECCEPSTGQDIAVLFLTMPNSPQCNN